MEFYSATYKRQSKENAGTTIPIWEWKDSCYDCQKIIVVADCLEDAKKKIRKALDNAEYDGRAFIDIPEIEVVHGKI